MVGKEYMYMFNEGNFQRNKEYYEDIDFHCFEENIQECLSRDSREPGDKLSGIFLKKRWNL